MKSNNLKTEYSQLRHKQQGAVLFVSLMILLVLTLIGVSSLNGSLLEEKMASNAQTSTTIFQTSESAIRTTYYNERTTPALVVKKALSGTTVERSEDYSSGDITSGTTLVYTRQAPLYNYSSSFVAHGVEISGTASLRGIQESNTQGYSVFPLPAL